MMSVGRRHTIALVNQHSGVGKTTSAIGLAQVLARVWRQRVLLVDADPLSSLTERLDVATAARPLLDDCMLGRATAHQCLVAVGDGIDLLPCSAGLVGFELEAINRDNRALVLRQVLEPLAQDYDHIVIDTPASLGQLTVNALAAADELIIPLCCDYFASEGMAELLSFVTKIRAGINPALNLCTLLATHVIDGSRYAQRNMAEIRKVYGPLVADAVISEGGDMMKCYERLVEELKSKRSHKHR